MKQDLFVSELNKQMSITGISGRTLSEKINKSSSYINQILNDRVKEVDYNTAVKIFEQLNLIESESLDYYLHLLGVAIPDKILNNLNHDMNFKHSFTIDHCYKNESERNYNKNHDDEYKNYKVSKAYIDASKGILNYRENYSFHKQNELTETIKGIYTKLNSYLENNFDPNDYSNNHNAEIILTTLKGLFDLDNKNTIPMFEFFLNLMKLPLQTIETVKTQNEILEFIKEKCILEYRFDKLSDKDNDPGKLNQLNLTFKQSIKK